MDLNNITTTLKDTVCGHILKKLMNNGRMSYKHTFLTTFNVILGAIETQKDRGFFQFSVFFWN